MDFMKLLQLALGLAPAVKSIYDAATTNLGVVDEIKKLSGPLATMLEELGAAFFPKANPTIAIVGGVIAAFDPDTTKWLQTSINTLFKAWGWLDVPLAVDGLYGPKTRAAVEKVQTKLGLKVDGLLGKVTKPAIEEVLSHLPVLK